jgi:hypothetical protein
MTALRNKIIKALYFNDNLTVGMITDQCSTAYTDDSKDKPTPYLHNPYEFRNICYNHILNTLSITVPIQPNYPPPVWNNQLPNNVGYMHIPQYPSIHNTNGEWFEAFISKILDNFIPNEKNNYTAIQTATSNNVIDDNPTIDDDNDDNAATGLPDSSDTDAVVSLSSLQDAYTSLRYAIANIQIRLTNIHEDVIHIKKK